MTALEAPALMTGRWRRCVHDNIRDIVKNRAKNRKTAWLEALSNVAWASGS